MRGFIVYSTYRISDDKNKALVYLFGRLENGQSFLTINEYNPYFYIKTKDKKFKFGLAKKKTNNSVRYFYSDLETSFSEKKKNIHGIHE